MSELRAALSAELTRIIQCPYPASLSALADLLARAETWTIRGCLRDQAPCAVSKLVTIVCDALPLWSYTLRVLEQLCHAPEFQHELLSFQPGLLNALLVKANASHQGLADYGEFCVLLLSRQLPCFVPLPAAAQEFFLKVFNHAVKEPKVETLKPVYYMLDGACHQLLSLLPDEVQREFDQQLCCMLSSNSAGNNSMLLLWCFGIVLLTERCNSLRSKPETGFDQEWKTSSGQKLFSSTKGLHKTITLTCMSVVLAMKDGVGVSSIEATESIHVATRLLQYIDSDARCSWAKSGPLPEKTLAKLLDKIERLDTSSRVLVEALSFCALLIAKEDIGTKIVRKYEQCLGNITEFADFEGVRETLSISLVRFAPLMHRDSLSLLLGAIIDACLGDSICSDPSNLVALIEELANTASLSLETRTNFSHALSTGDVERKVRVLIAEKQETVTSTCHSYQKMLQSTLISTTIAGLLTIAFVAQAQGTASSASIAISLINAQRDYCPTLQKCAHKRSINTQPDVSLFQQSCTQYTGQHLYDWRDRMRKELESQGHYQRDAIVRSVAQICEDLELRCNTVEEPLQQEREKSSTYEKRINHLNQEIVSLQSRITDDELHLQGMEEEKEISEKERQELLDEKNRLCGHIEDLKKEMDVQRKRTEQITNRAKERELELQSTILGHEDTIRECALENKNISGILRQLQNAHGEQKNELEALEQQQSQLHDQLRDTKQMMIEEREQASKRVEQLHRLEMQKLELGHRLVNTEAELQVLTQELKDLQVVHQGLIQSSERSLQESEAKHAQELSAAAEERAAHGAELRSQLQHAEDQVQRSNDALERLQRELHEVQTSVPPLTTRVQELTDLCSEQEDELDELRTLRRNVLASFNLSTKPSLAIRTAARSQDTPDPPTSRDMREHRRRKSHIAAQETSHPGLSYPQESTTSVLENASFVSSGSLSSQHGRTPKRRKPRPTFKVGRDD